MAKIVSTIAKSRLCEEGGGGKGARGARQFAFAARGGWSCRSFAHQSTETTRSQHGDRTEEAGEGWRRSRDSRA